MMAAMASEDGRRETVLTGEVVNYETPDWAPLENIIEDDVCSWFMWMSEMELEDGTRIHAYKHRWNRRYLHLSARGEAFVFIWKLDEPDFDPDAPSEYERVQLRKVLSAVLGPPRWPAVEADERTLGELVTPKRLGRTWSTKLTK